MGFGWLDCLSLVPQPHGPGSLVPGAVSLAYHWTNIGITTWT